MMLSSDQERQRVALDRLSLLAEALEKIGVKADLVPDHLPFPGLAVRVLASRLDHPLPTDVLRIPAGIVVILAGRAHYWRQLSNGDLQLIGSFADPNEAAGKILDRLRSRKRHL